MRPRGLGGALAEVVGRGAGGEGSRGENGRGSGEKGSDSESEGKKLFVSFFPFARGRRDCARRRVQRPRGIPLPGAARRGPSPRGRGGALGGRGGGPGARSGAEELFFEVFSFRFFFSSSLSLSCLSLFLVLTPSLKIPEQQLSLLDRPPWISKSRGAEGREETLVLGGRGWELQQQEQGQGEGEEEDQEFLFPLQTALSWLSLLFLCLGASFSSSSFSKPSSSFCALKSDLRDWSPNSEGQFLGTRLASLLKKNPIALAAVPPLAGVLLPLAEAAAAGRGSRGGRRGGSGVRGEAAAAAARACCFGGGGLSSFSSSSAPSPLLVEVVSSSSSSNDDDDIEAAIDATDWGEVASSCLRRLLAGKKKESGEEGEGEEEEKEQGGGDENETSSSSSRSPSWAGLGAVVKALEEQPELASSSSASASPSRGGRAGAARARGLVRVCAWAAETPGNDDDGKTSSTSPWSESFELELDPKGSSEEVDLPGCRKGLRRKLRVVAAPLAEEGGGTALVLPPTLPPSGRLVASTFNCSSSASASYRLPSCELSLDIDSLPKSLWVMLGSFEEDDEENESETVNEKSEEEAKLRNSKKFILQLKLRRQTAGRASRRSHYGAWGAYAPCGGAITTLL